MDGVDERLPVTLTDVALGFIFAIGTVILTRRFPALLEIILIRRFDMPAGNRYTVITLTAYIIAAAGIVLVFNTVGASWSKIQWLVPNKEFITGRLLNWSLSDQTIRLVLTVSVAYGSDVRCAMKLLREAEDENPLVLDEPCPSVIFHSFGDNALTISNPRDRTAG